MRFYLKLLAFVLATFGLQWVLDHGREPLAETWFAVRVAYVVRFGDEGQFEQLIQEHQDVLQRQYHLNWAAIAVEIQRQRHDEERLRRQDLHQEPKALAHHVPDGANLPVAPRALP